MFQDQHPILGGRLNPTNPLFKELDILKVQDIFKISVLKFIYDWLNGHTPLNFKEWFTLNNSVHSYNTTSNVV